MNNEGDASSAVNPRARTLAPGLALLALIACLAAPLPQATGKQSQPPLPFKVGASSVSTTPDEPLCLGGYGAFCVRPMKGVKDPLSAEAIAIKGRGSGTVVLVKTSAVGLFAAYKREQGATGIYNVRQQISRQTGVPAEHVIVNADHSHASPDTIGIWGGVPRSYMEQLAASMTTAARRAVKRMRPARLWVANVRGPKLRSLYSHKPTDAAAMDREFRALFAKTRRGRSIATIVNHAPHATACGYCDDMATGDWPAWAMQEIRRRKLGVGVGLVGALGSTDWGKTGDLDEREAAVRKDINRMLTRALRQKQRVRGRDVGASMTFVNEPLLQPLLAVNLVPSGVVDYGEGDLRIDRATSPPWLSGTIIGTYAGAVRIGDVFMSTFPGEPFPQLQDALRGGGVVGPSSHFLLGTTNDFLGYMVADFDQYWQAFQEGALYLAGCPEQAVTHELPGEHDEACPDHWTLMVSPTIGRHMVCSIQDAAARLGFEIGERWGPCEVITALDGVGAPPEHPGS